MNSLNDNSKSSSELKQDHTEMASPLDVDTYECFNYYQDIGSVGKVLNSFMPKCTRPTVEVIDEESSKNDDYECSDDEDIPLLKNVKIPKSKKEKKRSKNKKYRSRRRKTLKSRQAQCKQEESRISSNIQVISQKMLELHIKEITKKKGKDRNKRKKRTLKEEQKKVEVLKQLLDLRKAKNGGVGSNKVVSRTDFKAIEEIKKIEQKKVQTRHTEKEISDLIRNRRKWDKYVINAEDIQKLEIEEIKSLIIPKNDIQTPLSVPLDWVEHCYPETLEDVKAAMSNL